MEQRLHIEAQIGRPENCDMKGQQRRCEGSACESKVLTCPEGAREHWPMKAKVSFWPGSRDGGCGPNSKRVSHYGCANVKGQQRTHTTGLQE